MVDRNDIPTATEVINHPYISEESIPTAPPLTDDNDSITDIVLTDEMKLCYMLSNSLKCCMWCECLLAMIFTFSNVYMTIPLLFAYLGYIGTKNFNKNIIILYFIYLTTNNTLRIYFFLHYFLPLSQKERDIHILSFILVIICCVMEIFTSYVSYLFYHSIRQLPSEDLEFLKLLDDRELRQALME